MSEILSAAIIARSGKLAENLALVKARRDRQMSLVGLHFQGGEQAMKGISATTGNNARFVDITGERYGRLIVFMRAGTKNNAAIWLCICDCGNLHIVNGSKLRIGRVNSCGCLKSETTSAMMTTHGKSKSITYRVWHGMIRRCTKPNTSGYEDYGGRGITVCARWLVFENFYADMGDRPVGCSLDRKNVNGNYEPGNCRWATPIMQGGNKRNNRFYTANGKTQTFSQWERECNLPRGTISVRIRQGLCKDNVLKPINK